MLREWLLSWAPMLSSENRRRSRRYARVTYIEIQPLDEDLSICGPPAWGMTQDFSKHGIGFTTPFWLDCIYLRFTVREDHFSGYGIVRHNRILDAVDSGLNQYFVGIELFDEKTLLTYSIGDRRMGAYNDCTQVSN